MADARLQRIWDNGACAQCAHAHDDGSTCDAYPDGIPIIIASGELDHLQPRAGDHGVTFEPVEDADDSPPEPDSQCLSCHWLSEEGDGSALVCAAFPQDIPGEIFANYYDHRRGYEGDDGVRFRPRVGADPAELKVLYAALDQVPPHRPLDMG